ncbi:hypothetical protein FHETE_5441 [Fusarium heterosporum]|uniref:SUN domain-containing protein n=1 Tax=Fusarium heterosporum TaxID=42747 RepID=A0A8H5TF70_FUSHE|nr:hypothetical protein FHETE_5441 [Fusarium heterosporum]
MPPRPARRSTRFTSREPEQGHAHDSPNGLVRPQLPVLQGTPSSRRQYTYGSAAEPPPRVGAGLQRMDLQNAVNQALSRPDDEEEFVRPARPKSTATRTENTTIRENASRVALEAAQQLAPGRDDDSSRSFGLESDYYEGATIGPATTSTLGPENQQAASKSSLRNQRGTTDERDLQPRTRDPPHTMTQAGKNGDTQTTAAGTTRHTREKSRDLDATQPKKGAAPATGMSANTPALNKTRQDANRLEVQKPQITEDNQEEGDSNDDSSESEIQTTGNTRQTQSGLFSGYRPAPQKPFQDRRRPRDNVGSLFSQGNVPKTRTSAIERALLIPDDPRERDRLIQQEIQEAEDQLARERAEREGIDHVRFQARTWQDWLIQRFAWLLSSWPFNLLWRQHEADEFDDFDDDEVNQGGPTEWWRLLNPMTYLDSVIWLVEKIIDHAIDLIDRIAGIQVRNSWIENLLWTVTVGSVGLLLGAFIISGSAALRPSLPSFPEMGSMPTGSMHWPSSSGFTSRIGNIIPSFSWPSWEKEDDDASNPWDAFPIDNIAIPDNYKQALDELKKHANGQKKTLNTLKSVLPTIVHMDLVDGRPVIKQEFWHALQDLLKKDGSFLNLDHKNGNYEVSSEQQWRAIVSRLEKDSSFNKKLKTDVDHRIEDKLPNFWDTWFRNNNDVLQPLFEKAMAKRETAGSGAAFDQKLYKIVNEELIKYNSTAVSREEFLAHLKKDFTTHESDIKEQLASLESRMKSHIEESIRSARMLAPQGTSDNEMRQLVRDIVRQTLTDGTLAAAAKSNIHAHYNLDLKHQVNFFGTGAGATMDSRLTTPVWDPYDRGIATEVALRRGLSGLQPLPAAAVLHPWQDEGDCFCASHGVDDNGHPHGAVLSIHLGHLVVPENIVIEHIHPDATTDPDARPRHIEVLARFDNKEEFDIVRDLSANQVTNKMWNFNPAPLHEKFVKISQFEYQGDQLNEGVHVQRISGDFVNLGIPTDHIIIRALSNYGAKDHTCIYRVKLFGKEKPDELV